MDRDRMFKNVRDSSKFKENADNKVIDRRSHESYINDRGRQDEKIHDNNNRQLERYRPDNKVYDPDMPIARKIESYRNGHHESGAHLSSGKSAGTEIPSGTVKYAGTSAYTGFIQEDRSAPDATRYVSPETVGRYHSQSQPIGGSKYNRVQSDSDVTMHPPAHAVSSLVSGKYNNEAHDTKISDHNQGMQNREKYDDGKKLPDDSDHRKYSSGRYEPGSHVSAKYDHAVVTATANRIEGSFDTAKINPDHGFETPSTKTETGTGIQDNYAAYLSAVRKKRGERAEVKIQDGIVTVERSYLSSVPISPNMLSKVKGHEESKNRNIKKIKGNGRDAFKKKSGNSRVKYKKKIGTGVKKANFNKIKTEAASSIINKANEEDRNEAVSASAVAIQALGGHGITGGVIPGNKKDPRYRAYMNRVNNANAKKFLEKAGITKEAEKGKAGAGAPIHKAEGKYSGIGADRLKQLSGKQEAVKRTRRIRAEQQKKILKDFRKAKEAEGRTITVFRGIKQHAIRYANKLKYFVKRNTVVIASVAAFLVMVIVVSAGFSSCAMAFTTGTGTYMGGTSDASDFDMTDTDNYFTQKEMELNERIEAIPGEYPDYDEYVYDLDDIGHEARALMAYLSAQFGSYELSSVQAELDSLFDELYKLTLTPRTEIRTRMVRKVADDGIEYDVSEEYEWKILTVTLRKKDIKEIAKVRLTDVDKKEMFDIYLDTGGAHQAFYNPFTVDWKAHVSSEFGWRVHPILGKEKFHNGIDIALPAGTEVHACSTGKVIQSYMSSSAGNYVVVQDASGYTCHYMHLSSRAVAVGDVVKHGDLIGKVGSTGRSTGPHLHLGIKDNNGEWQNPRFLLSDFVKSGP